MLRFEKRLPLVLLLSVMLTGVCAQEDQYQTFGDQITSESTMAYHDLLKVLDGKDSVQAKVEGLIDNVCQVKGCWMNVVDKNGDEESLFVKFKDYGFFVPKDAAGKDVIIEGVAYRDITPVEELRHYAEDAGKSDDEIAKITEPKEEVRFVAKGVLIKK